MGTENQKLGWKTKSRTWNSIVEVRARNDKNKDDDDKEQFGTKKEVCWNHLNNSFRNKEGNVKVKIYMGHIN